MPFAKRFFRRAKHRTKIGERRAFNAPCFRQAHGEGQFGRGDGIGLGANCIGIAVIANLPRPNARLGKATEAVGPLEEAVLQRNVLAIEAFNVAGVAFKLQDNRFLINRA